MASDADFISSPFAIRALCIRPYHQKKAFDHFGKAKINELQPISLAGRKPSRSLFSKLFEPGEREPLFRAGV